MMKPIPFKGDDPEPLVREIADAQPYPLEETGPLKPVIEAVVDITQAPVAIAAQSALAIASLAAQPFANVQTLGGDKPVSIYCLTVAASGDRKSSCDNLLMKGLRDYEREEEVRYRDELDKYEFEIEAWKNRRRTALKDNGSSNCGQKPQPPLLPNRTATEPTFEGLVKLSMRGNPSLGVFSDEGGGFFGGHAMNSDNRLKTVAGLSTYWDGSPINRTRAGDGAATLRGRRLSIHLMIQHVVAGPLLADRVANQQGFLARFLICQPKSTIGTRKFREPEQSSLDTVEHFNERIGQYFREPYLVSPDDKQELCPPTLKLDPEARVLLIEYYDKIEEEQRPQGELCSVTQFASKSAELAARIAGVLTLYRSSNAVSIDAEMMRCGISLAQYYLTEALRLVDNAQIGEASRHADELRIWLRDTWKHDEIMPSEVVQSGPSHLREMSKAQSAIRTLVEFGHLVALEKGTEVRGKPRKAAYKIVRS